MTGIVTALATKENKTAFQANDERRGEYCSCEVSSTYRNL